MPAEYNPSIAPPPLPSMTVLDLIAAGYDDVSDYFPQSGQGQAIVAPYLDKIELLQDSLATNEAGLADALNALDQLLTQILENAGFVPSDDFQQKASELENESLQSPQDLAKMLQLAQEALALYDALSDAERLEEAWNRALKSFQNAFQASRSFQFNNQEEEAFRQAKQDIQDFQDLYDQLKNDPDLDLEDKLKFEALNNDATVQQQILDLYLDNLGVQLSSSFYTDEVDLYWELAKNAVDYFFGEARPSSSMTIAEQDQLLATIHNFTLRRWALTMTKEDKRGLDHAAWKLEDYLGKYEEGVSDFGVAPNTNNTNNENKARADLISINNLKKSYARTADRFDDSKSLEDNEPDLNLAGDGYATAQSLGLNQLYPSNGDLSMGDIVQGELGDCFYLAAVAAIVGKDDDLIKNNIFDNGDGTYRVTLYLQGVQETINSNGDVVLERTDDPSARNAINIKVTPTFPVDVQGNSVYAAANNVYWIHLLEKALAQSMGGYDNITEGGFSDEALRMLTNDEVRSFRNWEDPDSLNKLKTQLDKGKIVTTGSSGLRVITNFTLSFGVTNNQAGSVTLESNHACAVTGYDAATQKFQLYNPHGWSFEVDEADFATFFSGFHVLDYED